MREVRKEPILRKHNGEEAAVGRDGMVASPVGPANRRPFIDGAVRHNEDAQVEEEEGRVP